MFHAVFQILNECDICESPFKIASNVTQIGLKQAQKVGHEKLLGV